MRAHRRPAAEGAAGAAAAAWVARRPWRANESEIEAERKAIMQDLATRSGGGRGILSGRSFVWGGGGRLEVQMSFPPAGAAGGGLVGERADRSGRARISNLPTLRKEGQTATSTRTRLGLARIAQETDFPSGGRGKGGDDDRDLFVSSRSSSHDRAALRAGTDRSGRHEQQSVPPP
jgi:hypothetical protein